MAASIKRLLITTISNNNKLHTTSCLLNQIRYASKKRIERSVPKNDDVDSGKTIIQIDPKSPQMYFEKSNEYKNANETIKKIFSLEYSNRVDSRAFEEKMIREAFQKDFLEENSLEIEIASHTLRLRRLDQLMIKYPKHKKFKFFYYRAYYRRDKMLNELLNTNYDRYLFVKDKLGLVWEPRDPLSERRSTSYGKFKDEVHTNALTQQKLKDTKLRDYFEEEKIDFFKEKDNFLKDLHNKLLELKIQVPGQMQQ